VDVLFQSAADVYRDRVLALVMKGMYGLDVLTKIRELDPDAKVIVVSADIQTSSRSWLNRPAPRPSSTNRSTSRRS
jgi:chemotaxis response regulator CheB